MTSRDLNSSPWPCMRSDMFNSGRFPELATWHVRQRDRHSATQVRRLKTDGPIFSTPVIGPDETIYVGSADHHLYAWNPLSEKTHWKYAAKGAIDSAALLDQDDCVYTLSCDGACYKLDSSGKQLWKHDAIRQRSEPTLSSIFWWEGNAALGPDGNLYAGNDDFYLYSFTPAGEVRWQYPTGLNIWSTPAFFGNLVIFGSFDFYLYALDMQTGRLVWRTLLNNCIVASPAISTDGIAYIGTLGGTLHGINAKTGVQMWKHEFSEHIYASATLDDDGKRLYIGDASGMFSCFSMDSHDMMWQKDLGSPIRASAALGPDPIQKHPYLIYIADDAGLLHALTPDSTTRWTYATDNQTSELNQGISASVALGNHGIALSSISGDCIWIPYTYAEDAPTQKIAMHRTPSLSRTPSPGTYSLEFRNIIFRSPSIISSLDLVGIASVVYEITLTIQPNGSLVAHGQTSFGSRDGHDGVVIPRVSVCDFVGHIDPDGTFTIVSFNYLFEITAFPVTVDEIRFSGIFDGSSIRNCTVEAVRRRVNFFVRARQFFTKNSFSFAVEYMRSILRSPKVLKTLILLPQTIAAVARVMRPHTRRAWRLEDAQGDIYAFGTYSGRVITEETTLSGSKLS